MYYLVFAAAMLRPLAMVVIGFKWVFKPPAFLSGGLSYRTAITEKSEEAWYFSHTYCGELWYRFGFFALVISVVLLLVFKNSYQKFVLWLFFAQGAVMCGSIFMIELFLKNLFDEDGNRIR